MRYKRKIGEIVENWGRDSTPLLSIICTTYNHVHFIENAINGFLMQETNFPFEIFIHDDASTDGTAEIIKNYEKKYPLIIKSILQTENQFSQNKKPLHILSPHAKGKYIALCEGDDYWTDPEKLQIQCDFLEQNESYSCCYHDAFSFDETGILEQSIAEKKDYSKNDLLYDRGLIRTLTLVYRNIFSEFPDEKNHVQNGDIFLASLLGMHGHGKYIPHIKPAAYRVHEGGIWSGTSFQQASIMKATSRYWLSVYHLNEGRKKVGFHLLGKAMFLLMRNQNSFIQFRTIITLPQFILMDFKNAIKYILKYFC